LKWIIAPVPGQEHTFTIEPAYQDYGPSGTIRMTKGASFNNLEGVYTYESQALGEIGPSANWKILKDPKGPYSKSGPIAYHHDPASH